MEIRAIKSSKQHQQYLDWVDEQLEKNISPTSKMGKLLEVVLILIKDYEDKHFPIPVKEKKVTATISRKKIKSKHKNVSGTISP